MNRDQENRRLYEKEKNKKAWDSFYDTQQKENDKIWQEFRGNQKKEGAKRIAEEKARKSRTSSPEKPDWLNMINYLFGVILFIIVIVATLGNKSNDTIEEEVGTEETSPPNISIEPTTPIPTETPQQYAGEVADFKSFGLINTEDNFLNFRSSPSVNEMNKIGSIPRFEVVEVLENVEETEVIDNKEGNWVRVKYHGLEGYIFGAYLKNLDSNAEYKTVNSQSGLVLRASPAVFSGNKLNNIPNKAIVTILERTGVYEEINGRNGEWVKVEYQSIKGFVFDAYVEDLHISHL